MILERKRLPVIGRAKERVLGRIDHDGTAGAERARIPRAIGCDSRPAGQSGQQRQCNDCPAHAPKGSNPVWTDPDFAGRPNPIQSLFGRRLMAA